MEQTIKNTKLRLFAKAMSVALFLAAAIVWLPQSVPICVSLFAFSAYYFILTRQEIALLRLQLCHVQPKIR